MSTAICWYAASVSAAAFQGAALVGRRSHKACGEIELPVAMISEGFPRASPDIGQLALGFLQGLIELLLD
jgi:hypothetical protein